MFEYKEDAQYLTVLQCLTELTNREGFEQTFEGQTRFFTRNFLSWADGTKGDKAKQNHMAAYLTLIFRRAEAYTPPTVQGLHKHMRRLRSCPRVSSLKKNSQT